MHCVQAEFDLNQTQQKPVLILRDIIAGNVVRIKRTKKIVMKLKITGFMLNSDLVAAVLNRGDCFICNLETGSLYATDGEVEVERLATKLQYTSVKD